jgi:hypothetical protein
LQLIEFIRIPYPKIIAYFTSIQLEAARIVTGLPIFASSILIYKELGWESLAERRKRRKLQMFHNIQNNNAPIL